MKRNLILMAAAMTALASCQQKEETTTKVPDVSATPEFGVYLPGDFHQHTTFSDGAASFAHVMQRSYDFGLAWWANSEHGGSFDRNGAVSGYDLDAEVKWEPSQIVNNLSPTGQKMWRWQSIEQYSFAEVMKARAKFPNKLIIQGLEWNPPGHEHASMAIVTGQFGHSSNASAVAEFEYRFDNNDKDMVGKSGWVKSTKTGHEKTLEALKWLQTNHGKSSWVVPAHPERQNKYSIADYRDMNNAAPDVCFGFESIPGHQASSTRGGIGNSSSYDKSGTFGGAGIMSARVGGLWDALLSEGRGWWLFASSDFHENASSQKSDDFYPGEYQKSYVSFKNGEFTAAALVDGMRSGNSFVVHGDLIDMLQFSVGSATMGQTYNATTNEITVKIVVRDPMGTNHNVYSNYNAPVLDHIDLIMGQVSGLIAPGDPRYTEAEVSTTKVVARFDAKGASTDANKIKSTAWKELAGGHKQMEIVIKDVTKDAYFRLRGTNHAIGSALLDAAGNPLADQPGGNTAAKAFEDLWFYSNPVFVKAVK